MKVSLVLPSAIVICTTDVSEQGGYACVQDISVTLCKRKI